MGTDQAPGWGGIDRCSATRFALNLKRKREQELRSVPMEKRDEIEEKHYIYFDEVLDHSKTGPRWLRNENIAQTIMEVIKSMDGNRYELIACCIMPNHESYDHFIRNDAELERTIRYILHNPIKAGLAKEWQDWKFTYISPEFGEW